MLDFKLIDLQHLLKPQGESLDQKKHLDLGKTCLLSLLGYQPAAGAVSILQLPGTGPSLSKDKIISNGIL